MASHHTYSVTQNNSSRHNYCHHGLTTIPTHVDACCTHEMPKVTRTRRAFLVLAVLWKWFSEANDRWGRNWIPYYLASQSYEAAFASNHLETINYQQAPLTLPNANPDEAIAPQPAFNWGYRTVGFGHRKRILNSCSRPVNEGKAASDCIV